MLYVFSIMICNCTMYVRSIRLINFECLVATLFMKLESRCSKVATLLGSQNCYFMLVLTACSLGGGRCRYFVDLAKNLFFCICLIC